MTISLITEYGRYDRAAITARAKELYRGRGSMTWADARSAAYGEAKEQIRSQQYTRPHDAKETKS